MFVFLKNCIFHDKNPKYSCIYQETFSKKFTRQHAALTHSVIHYKRKLYCNNKDLSTDCGNDWWELQCVSQPGRSVVGMDGSQAHPLSLDEKEAHLQSCHISLSSHPLSVNHKDKHTLLTHSDARCGVYAHKCTCSHRFSKYVVLFWRYPLVSLFHRKETGRIWDILPKVFFLSIL